MFALVNLQQESWNQSQGNKSIRDLDFKKN